MRGQRSRFVDEPEDGKVYYMEDEDIPLCGIESIDERRRVHNENAARIRAEKDRDDHTENQEQD